MYVTYPWGKGGGGGVILPPLRLTNIFHKILVNLSQCRGPRELLKARGLKISKVHIFNIILLAFNIL